MLPALLAAAMAVIAGISSGIAQPSAAMKQSAASSAPARTAPDKDIAGQPFDLAGSSVALANEAGNYKLSDGKAPDGGDWSPDVGTSGLSQNLSGSGPLHGLVLRLRAKRLFGKYSLVGGGSGVGPPQYAARKHLMLSLSQSF